MEFKNAANVLVEGNIIEWTPTAWVGGSDASLPSQPVHAPYKPA
jgi:hypothetical protein